jgi:DNA-binding NarL/FixJ family response regulator
VAGKRWALTVVFELARIVHRSPLGNHEQMPTVLIVDDHPSFRAAARALLEGAGWRVIGGAEDAASALAAAHDHRPDVVLFDVQLPDGDGFQVCEELARDSAARVVLVSSRDKADYGRRVERSGAAGFIAKMELSGTALAQALA